MPMVTHPASARPAPLPVVVYPPAEDAAEPHSADGLRVSEETCWTRMVALEICLRSCGAGL
ncbi:MAG TPA: hypothetical protein VES73_09100 [Lamprocystis sp. (in: g-proteobacteria)]|nr:hypothetical protein [Lamprocystis sp. (in: g-proteobacteria)]